MFRLIVTDMDGTLVDPTMVIPTRTLAALRSAIANGCRFTIATGRHVGPTAPIAEVASANAPLILCQGALIQDHRTLDVVHRQTIPVDAASRVVEFADSAGLAFQLHTGVGEVYTGIRNPFRARTDTVTGITSTVVADLEPYLQTPPLKIVFFERESNLPGLQTRLEDQFGNQVQIVRSWRTLIEITALGVSKAEAMAHLAGLFGIDRSETMAVGDQDNDASMLRWAGLGVAMNASSAGAKAAADVVAPPCNGHGGGHDEGVAWAIERYVLGKP